MMYDIFHGHWLLKFEAYTKSDRTDKRERAIVDAVAPHRHSKAVDIGIPTAVSGNGKEVSDCEIYLEILDPFGSDRNVVRETQTVEPEVIALFQVVGRDIITPLFNQLVDIDDVESAGGRESGIDGKTVQAERGSEPSGIFRKGVAKNVEVGGCNLSPLVRFAAICLGYRFAFLVCSCIFAIRKTGRAAVQLVERGDAVGVERSIGIE